ncbi:putative gdp-fucose transporter protein [Golovinomyces cichoracearum]|uniref:GDP-mannose transporter n=1 Tax=Golovinomyces cichoracearum TaxID=62708 RepID=A0A420IRI4_9PEZI|nr:putative gdp-fucose transporter protein [Golovinomyces cichoracearum]
MLSNSQLSSNGLGVTMLPLVRLSRSPSPSQRRQSESNSRSETDDDDDWGTGVRTWKGHGWKSWIYEGGIGHFLFNTSTGGQFYIGLLILWLEGCQIGLILMNRIILWTGVYKFPYPLSTSLIELLITHFFVLLSANITRWFSPFLISCGLMGGIAPTRPLKVSSPAKFRNGSMLLGSFMSWIQKKDGGIAGGGLFEFDLEVAKMVLPCAFIFVSKVCLSNLSFAYAQIQVYFLARIAIVPISMLFTYFLAHTSYSVATISSALTATLTLLVAIFPANVRVTLESIVAGTLSSIFVALYPIQIQRTYRALVSLVITQGEYANSSSSIRANDYSGTKEESRAYWRLLHYTSLLSILIFIPIVILSGEIKNIWRNCYILDVFFHWLMVLCGGVGSWAVFWSTIALTRATSPLTVAFLFIPRAVFLSPIMLGWHLPLHSWIGVVMCWASSLWFLIAKRREGKDFFRKDFISH